MRNTKLPTLYARNKNGSVQEWTIEIDLNLFRTIVGQVGGALVVSDWTECQGKNYGKKNETTPDMQAKSEAQARWDKKLKEGYYKDINDIDRPKFFEPTLAKSYEDYKAKLDWSKGVAVQIKYNGGRVVANRHGLWTRTGEAWVSIPHIHEALKGFFFDNPDAVLDGEGFNFELREQLNEIMTLMRKSSHATAEDLARSKELIKFYVYDGFGFGGVTRDDDYLKRKAAIDKLQTKYSKFIGNVPTWIVYSEAELEELYKKFLEDNQEGAILRILGLGYENGRTKNLMKYKPVDDDEFKIIDVQEGTGNWAGTGKIIVCQRIDGNRYADGSNTFNATFKGSHDKAVKFLKEKDKYIGKTVTIFYNGLTGKGKPNYARLDIANWNKGDR